MKKSFYSFAMTSFTVILIFLLQSCAVGGLLVGSVMDSNDKYNYDIPTKSGEGWVVPDNRKQKVELLLTNGKIVIGKYLKIEQIYDGANFTDAVFLDTKSVNKRIPINMIAYTNYYREDKNHAHSGFMIGLGLDFLVITAVLATGGSIGPTISVPAFN